MNRFQSLDVMARDQHFIRVSRVSFSDRCKIIADEWCGGFNRDGDFLFYPFF